MPTFYGAFKEGKGYPQVKMKYKKGKRVSMERTGRVYRSQREAYEDLKKINGCKD